MLWRPSGSAAELVLGPVRFVSHRTTCIDQNARSWATLTTKTVVGVGQERGKHAAAAGAGGLQSRVGGWGLGSRAVDLEPDDFAVVVSVGTPAAGQLVDEVQASSTGAVHIGNATFGQRRIAVVHRRADDVLIWVPRPTHSRSSAGEPGTQIARTSGPGQCRLL